MHPITVCTASFIIGSMRQMRVLQHQVVAQCTALEWTKAEVAVRNIVSPESLTETPSLFYIECDP